MNDDLFEDIPHPDIDVKESDDSASKVDDSLFEDEMHPEAQRSLASVVEEQNQPTPSQLQVGEGRSALVGVGQGATFGFGEEITAPFAAAAGMASDLPSMPNESTWEKYQRLMQTYRDTAREEQQAAQEQNPASYTSGVLAGSLMSPGLGAAKAAKSVKDATLFGSKLLPKAIVGSATGAGMGSLAGAGEAEGSFEERLPAALEGAEVGGEIGLAIPVVGATLTAGKKLGKAIGKHSQIQDILNSYKYSSKGQNVVTKEGREQAADIVRDKASDFYDELKTIKDQAGKLIKENITEAESQGKKLDLVNQTEDVLKRLKIIQNEGSATAAEHARGLEKEIRKITGFTEKVVEDIPGGGISVEGLIEKGTQKITPSETKVITPTKAQDLRQSIKDYLPKRGMSPQELKSAGIAKELYSETGEQLSGLTENLAEANKEYGNIVNIIKRLGIKEKDKLPEQIKDELFKIVSQSEKQSMSGDMLRNRMSDVMNKLNKDYPEIAQKYTEIFDDVITRLDLATKLEKGGFISPRTFAPTIAGYAGLGVKEAKEFVKPVTNVASKVLANIPKPITGFTKEILNTTKIPSAISKSEIQGSENVSNIRQMAEPYKLQRQVASAAENAEPDFLKNQANQIRQQYGNQGEQLATILTNMADKDKNARRALMFTVLQNQAYRKMLGLMDEQAK